MLEEVVISTSYIAEFPEVVGDMMLTLLKSGVGMDIIVVNFNRERPWKNDA